MDGSENLRLCLAHSSTIIVDVRVDCVSVFTLAQLSSCIRSPLRFTKRALGQK